MKVLTENALPGVQSLDLSEFTLPHGIVGFPDYTEASLICHQGHFPCLWMRLKGPVGSVNFVVIEPKGIIPDYQPELFDNDALALGLAHASEALVLTILTMRPGTPVEATVNLIGPVVVNRRTRIGRQLVIANYSRYRARQPLAALPPAAASASA